MLLLLSIKEIISFLLNDFELNQVISKKLKQTVKFLNFVIQSNS